MISASSSTPSQPLLSMPAPSPELMPVLHARAVAAAKERERDSGSMNTAGGLLITRSASASGALTLTSSTPSPSASSSLVSSSQLQSQFRALESASMERERSLRIQLEEARVALRSKNHDLTEAQLLHQRKVHQWDAEREALNVRLEKLQQQIKFVYNQEAQGAAKIAEMEAEMEALRTRSRQQENEMMKLQQQLAEANQALDEASSTGTTSIHRPLSPSAASAAATAAGSSAQISHLQSLVDFHSDRADNLQRQLNELQHALEQFESTQSQLQQTKYELEHSNARVEELESLLKSKSSQIATVDLLQRHAGELSKTQHKLESVQAENVKLRARQSSEQILQERINSLQNQLERMEALRKHTAEVEEMNDQLRERLKAWEDSMMQLELDSTPTQEERKEGEDDTDMLDSSAPTKSKRPLTPHAFISSYSELQQTNLTLHARCITLESSSNASQRQLKELQQTVEELRNKLQQFESDKEKATKEHVSLSRRVTLLTKEKEGLQKVLDAYEEEEQRAINKARGKHATTPSNLAPDVSDAENAEQNKALKTKTQVLEGVVQELEQQLRSFQTENGLPLPRDPSASTASASTKPIPSVVTLLARISSLESQVSSLDAEATNLSEKVDWVQKHYPHMLDTEYPNLRVLSLPATNPSHQRWNEKVRKEREAWKKEKEILQLKLEETKQQLNAALASGGSSATAMDTSSSSSTASTTTAPSSSALLELESSYTSKLQSLQTENAQLEKKSQRLKEIFGQKVLEFRNTCYLLTGFKIELISAAKYRLKSMYAEKEEDELVFQQEAAGEGSNTPSGGLSVLETEFTKSLDGSITGYLERMNSIPGFLAAIQLHLLEKQTRIR